MHSHRPQDGALLANNPAAIALHEARLLFPGRRIACIASFGTGVRAASETVKPAMAPSWFNTMQVMPPLAID